MLITLFPGVKFVNRGEAINDDDTPVRALYARGAAESTNNPRNEADPLLWRSSRRRISLRSAKGVFIVILLKSLLSANYIRSRRGASSEGEKLLCQMLVFC